MATVEWRIEPRLRDGTVKQRQRDRWTQAEDRLLIEAQKKHGNRWTRISKLLRGRTNNAVKNRYSLLWRREARDFLKLAMQEMNAERPAPVGSDRDGTDRPEEHREARVPESLLHEQSPDQITQLWNALQAQIQSHHAEVMKLRITKQGRPESHTEEERLIISGTSVRYASNADKVINPLQQQNRTASCEAGLGHRVMQYEKPLAPLFEYEKEESSLTSESCSNNPGQNDHEGTSRYLSPPKRANSWLQRPALCEALFAVPESEPTGMRNSGTQQFGSQNTTDSGLWSPASSSVLCETQFSTSELSSGVKSFAPEHPTAPWPKQCGSPLMEQNTTEHATRVTGRCCSEGVALKVNVWPGSEETRTRDLDFNEANFEELLRFLGFE